MQWRTHTHVCGIFLLPQCNSVTAQHIVLFWQKHAQQETRRGGYHHDIADELAVSRGLSWRKYHLSDCLQWIAAGENKRGPLAPPTGAGTGKHRCQAEKHQTLTQVMTKAEFNTIAGASSNVQHVLTYHSILLCLNIDSNWLHFHL